MPYFVFDVETTGLDPTKDEILELGGILVDDSLRILGKGLFRLEPKDWSAASKEALVINKIKPENWKPTHKSPKEALEKMYDFIFSKVDTDESVGIMGYNLSFDLAFLEALHKEADVKFKLARSKKIDVLTLFNYWVFLTGRKVKSRSLSHAIEVFGFQNDNPHSALYDAMATLKLYKVITEDLISKINKGGILW